MKPRIWILEGFGIECEKETRRFFENLEAGFKIQSLFLPKLFSDLKNEKIIEGPRSGEWIFFPGGFSFSDHFGSGALLSYELKRSGLLSRWLDEGVNLFGICNGFQILTTLGLFGAETQLLHNRAGDRGLGFINRWVSVEYAFGKSRLDCRFPVRHGEGRLSAPSLEYLKENGVEAFLRYRDPAFSNGSLDSIAGVYARHGKSWIVGMMPHPEIAVRENQGPYRFAGDAMPQHREMEQKKPGDGQRFFHQLFRDLEENRK